MSLLLPTNTRDQPGVRPRTLDMRKETALRMTACLPRIWQNTGPEIMTFAHLTRDCTGIRIHMLHALMLLTLVAAPPRLATADDAAAMRRLRAMTFHLRAAEGSGVLIPMYVYPASIHTNPVYNRVMEIKRRFETVPIWVVLNPASGPGQTVDANYTKAIDRLQGAGCVVLGYVATGYAKRPEVEVRNDIDQWLALYPRIQGIFFDEMTYEDTDAAVQYQVGLNRYAQHAGCWPTVGNPGAATPGRYFAADAADVIIIHEGSTWPTEQELQGDYFGGYADYPPFTRGVLVHSQSQLDPAALRMVRKYARWIYVTDRAYRPSDPRAANPWDRVSAHLETICEQLSGN